MLLATARALSGQRAGAIELAQNAGAESRDELDRRLAAAEVALAAGDVGLALEIARDTAVLAERAHRTIELASALVIVARLELARGDRGNARAAATRAAREAAAAGLVRVRVHALLALSALARDDDDPVVGGLLRPRCLRARAGRRPAGRTPRRARRARRDLRQRGGRRSVGAVRGHDGLRPRSRAPPACSPTSASPRSARSA